MYWSLDFYEADLKGLEKGKAENKGPEVPDYSTRAY